jgi:RNA polymerase sigma-B factor
MAHEPGGETNEALHRRYRAGDGDRQAIVDELARRYRPFVESFARRFSYRGEPYDDLVQVSWYAALRAVDRYDPDLGFSFHAYAARCITGELKRHFRDKGWAVRIPRSLLELYLDARDTGERMSLTLGRRPTVPELAAALNVAEDTLLEAQEVGHAYRAKSIDAPVHADEEGGRDIASTEAGYADVDETLTRRHLVETLLGQLADDEERLVRDYFFAQRTQSDIAADRNLSQVTVSRRLANILTKLRSRAEELDASVA